MRAFAALCLLLVSTASLLAQDVWLYIGTYTNQGSKGVYASKFNLKTGDISAPELVAETPNPTFLAIHPSRRFLYAANEVGEFNGEKSGMLTAFAIDKKTGKLTQLNQASSKGAGPCHVTVDKTGNACLVANYGAGTVAALGIDRDGKLRESTSFHQHQGTGPNEKRQEKAHAHSINPSPGNKYAVAADLGTDTLYVYKLDPASATLTLNTPEGTKTRPGAGPRHFAFHPNKKWGFVINELGNTLNSYTWDEKAGTLTEIASMPTLPADYGGTSYTAEVSVHPSGKYVYGSNRGMDSIAVFRLSPSGQPQLIQNISTGGVMPRNFTIDKKGRWLLAANQRTGNIAVFSIDPATGRLTDTGKRIELSAPVCLRILE